MAKAKPVSIGTIAKAAGVSVEAIRYYESEGLLDKARRTDAGYRQYAPDVVRRLSFIRRAKDLGFALDEIRDLLKLRVSPKGSCASVRAKAEKKLAIVDAKIQALQQIKAALTTLVARCSKDDAPTSACPILDALANEQEEGVH